MTERMQFFSRAWQAGDLTEEEAEAVSERYYREHLPAIASRLSPALRELAEHRAASGEILGIHDALIRRSVVNRSRGELRLELRAGDLQVGYYDLDLIYDRVDFARSDWAVLRQAGSAERVELLYHEIDLTTDEWFVHRILCWPQVNWTWYSAPFGGSG